MVERYIDWKHRWDKRCGGPSAQSGYKGFDEEFRATASQPTAKPTSSEQVANKTNIDASPSGSNSSAPRPSPSDTGKLALPGCPRVFREAFLAGTEPVQACDLHRF